MDVSIIIVNWNTRQITCQCLESVFRQPGTFDFEVIVVDNASSDGSVDAIRREFSQVRLIENEENRGFAAANNQGMAIARGRYVLLLNSDTVVLDGAIAKTVAFADRNPRAAIVGCRVLNPDRTLQPTCFMFPSLLNMFMFATYLNKLSPGSRLFGRERMTWWNRDDVREVDVVTGCFMLVRREAIDEVGMMDESFFMYGEETDWCYRFRQAKWAILFTPEAEIVHLGGASSDQLKGPMCLQLRASTLLFMKKHRGSLSYALCCMFVSLFFLLRIPFWLAKAVASHNRDRDHWRTVCTYTFGAWRALCGWQALSHKKQ